jgi:hypothetical protein
MWKALHLRVSLSYLMLCVTVAIAGRPYVAFATTDKLLLLPDNTAAGVTVSEDGLVHLTLISSSGLRGQTVRVLASRFRAPNTPPISASLAVEELPTLKAGNPSTSC